MGDFASHQPGSHIGAFVIPFVAQDPAHPDMGGFGILLQFRVLGPMPDALIREIVELLDDRFPDELPREELASVFIVVRPS